MPLQNAYWHRACFKKATRKQKEAASDSTISEQRMTGEKNV